MKMQSLWLRKALCVSVVAVGLVWSIVPPAHAATIPVGCSVSELITAINTANATPEADTLELSTGCLYALTAVNNTGETYGPNGLPVVVGDLTLNGNGATLTRAEGAPRLRFFQIPNAASLTLNDLLLKNGQLEPTSEETSAYPGGAIYNLGTLAVTDGVLQNNWAHEAGGGIYNNGGSVTIIHSTFSNNGENWAVIATVYGGAVYSQNGTLAVSDSEFRNNLASYDGGAIYNLGTLSVANSLFLANTTTLQQGTGGGAIYSAGEVVVNATMFDGNNTMLYGGALYVGSTGTVSNSTFVRNSAYGSKGSGGGGAIFGGADVSNSTFANNFVGLHANGAAIGAGGTVVNSTFASNLFEGDWPFHAGITGAVLKNSIVYDTACNGITDGGGNLYWPKTNSACSGKAGNPRLGLLRDNGGPTQTMALGVDSPALDVAVDANCPTSDQRGVSRPQGSRCDIGAFELALTTVDETAPSVTFGHWRIMTLGGSTMRVSNRQEDTITFTFKGRSVQWQTWRGPAFGMANVVIDGQDKGTFDLYAPYPVLLPERTFKFSDLGKGKHKLTIRVLGKKNVEATDTNVALDKFVVRDKTTLPTALKIAFNHWKGGKNAMAIGGTYRASADANARAEFTFSGPGVQWMTATGPAYGKAIVYIDGTQRGGVWDLYAHTQTRGVAIPFGGLSEGQHTFVLVVLGKKNVASNANTVVVDAFRGPFQ